MSHYTDGRRYSHISHGWIFESSWNDREEVARLKAAVADLERRLAELKEARAEA